MDDGEIDFNNQDVFSSPNMADQLPSSCSMDSFFDEILKDTHACTHTHTCNPPGPDSTHTHTCFHVHTKIVPATGDDKVSDTAQSVEKPACKSKKQPLGNKEAVRKYREKVKARAASLEHEVLHLRAVNQQLMKRLQGQSVLEAEISRLKCLLVDIRGRIDGEIGCFPYQQKMGRIEKIGGGDLSGGYALNPCNLQCDDDEVHCLHPGMGPKDGEANGFNGHGSSGQGLGGCEIEDFLCNSTPVVGLKEFQDCGYGNVASTVALPPAKKRKRVRTATTEG